MFLIYSKNQYLESMNRTRLFLGNQKYELLLAALIIHLFIGVFLLNLSFYTRYIWPITMLILGIASVGVFIEKGRWKNLVRNLLFLIVLGLPLAIPFMSDLKDFMQILSLMYVLFFAFILLEVLKFLIRPGYINIDLLSAAACGYFLLIETGVFLMQFFYYQNPQSFLGIKTKGVAAIFTDFVYFCSITVSTIGYGDITPDKHNTKLATSLFGICGQLYSVILIGILISKFSSKVSHPLQEE